MTREAADELGLTRACGLIAAVKATNVVIEVPGPRRKGIVSMIRDSPVDS